MGGQRKGGDANIKPCYQKLCVMSKGISEFIIFITGFVVGLPPHVLDPHYALSELLSLNNCVLCQKGLSSLFSGCRSTQGGAAAEPPLKSSPPEGYTYMHTYHTIFIVIIIIINVYVCMYVCIYIYIESQQHLYEEFARLARDQAGSKYLTLNYLDM